MPKPRPTSGELAYCTVCRKQMLVERPTTGSEGTCPICGSLIWLTNTKPDTDLIILVDGKVVEPISFEARDWSSGSLRLRGAMAADLISTRRLMKQTRSEIVKLLGKPGGDTENGIWYGVDLGRRDDFRGLPYRLRIDFDEEGLAKRVELEKHHLR